MMNKTSRPGEISAGQLFVMLFISRIIVTMTYSSDLSDGDSLWQHLLSSLISFALTFILLVPVLCLRKKYRDRSVLDLSLVRFGSAGRAITVFYGLYFALVAVYTLTSYGIFLDVVTDEPLPSAAILAAIIICACYGAYKGVEAMARMSGVVLAGFCITFILLLCALLPDISATNYEPIAYVNIDSVSRGLMLMLSRMSCIPALAVLYPRAKGDITRAAVKWNIAVFMVITGFIILLTGAMGDYLAAKAFPVYEAAAVGDFGMGLSLDAVYTGIWTAGIFCKVSLFLYLSSYCLAGTFSTENERRWIIPVAAVILISSLVLVLWRFDSFLFDSAFWIAATIVAAVLLPLIFLVGKIKVKKIKAVNASALITVVACLFGMFNMSGCNAVQLSDKLIIQGVGIDWSDDGCRLTMLVLDTDTGAEEETTAVMYSDGTSVGMAFSNAESVYGKEIMLSHNLFILMNGDGAYESDTVLRYFIDDNEARDTAYLFVTSESAEDFITAASELGYSAHDIVSLSLSGSESGSLGATVADYISSNEGLNDLCVPVVSLSENYAFISGSAVFKDGDFCGYMNENQTLGYLFVSGKALGVTFTSSEDDSLRAVYSVSEQSNTISIELDGDNLCCRISIEIAVEQKLSSEDIEVAQSSVLEFAAAAVQTSLKEYGCDVFGLIQAVKNSEPDFYKNCEDIYTAVEEADIYISCRLES